MAIQVITPTCILWVFWVCEFCESHGRCWLRLPEATQKKQAYTHSTCEVGKPVEAAPAEKSQGSSFIAKQHVGGKGSEEKTCHQGQGHLVPGLQNSFGRSNPASMEPNPQLGEVWSRIKKPFRMLKAMASLRSFPLSMANISWYGHLRTFLLQEGEQQKPPHSPLKCIHPTHLTHRHSLHQQSVHLEFWGDDDVQATKNRGVQ